MKLVFFSLNTSKTDIKRYKQKLKPKVECNSCVKAKERL